MKRCVIPTMVLLGLLMALAAYAGDWPGFRGPRTDGISAETQLPTHWGPEKNVVWKTKLPGLGASSPIVWQDRVFVTCFTGKAAKEITRHLVCLDRKNGQILWQKDLPATQPENDYSAQRLQHGFSTSTPVTDGERVYVYYGRTGALAYDFKGNELWRNELGKYLNTFGTGSSPALYRDFVLINASIEAGHLFALHKSTGKVAWKLPVNGDCWATPLIVDVENNRQELVLNASGMLIGYDPEHGKELWQCEYIGANYSSSTPVARKGIVYVMGSGAGDRIVMAVRTGGRGDVTKTHIVWQKEKVGASYCSPVLVGEHFYYFSTAAYCLRADNGETVYQQRLTGVATEYASPVFADGRIYVPTRWGTVHVVKPGTKFEVLASNDLGDSGGFTASPAVSNGQLFLRTNTHLYCIGEKK
jgi:hypothetical protein